MTPEEKARRRKFRDRRFIVAIPKTLHDAIKRCAYTEGRSMSNFIATTLWNYMQQTHGVKIEGRILHYRAKLPRDAEAETRRDIDELLKEGEEDNVVGGS